MPATGYGRIDDTFQAEPGPPARMDTIGRRIIRALATLPELKRSLPRLIHLETGVRVRRYEGDENPRDYGTIRLIGPDGKVDDVPGHHYLDEHLAR